MANQRDGGYYALKGYLYQFNKTIKKILESEDENKDIGFEREQDIDDEDSIIQIKYKEESKFYNSSIKKPIIQLIKHYQSDSKKSFFLYCYFKNKNESSERKSIDINQLNEILGEDSCKFEDKIKTDFVSKFTLIFSDDFNSSFEAIIKKVKKVFNCKNDEEFFYHAVILNHLLYKVVNNKPQNIRNRQSSLYELRKIVKDTRNAIFFSAHRQIIGDDKYFSMVKKQYLSHQNIPDWERFFIIEVKKDESITDLKECVLKIRKKFYVKSSKTIRSGAPYIFFNGIKSKTLATLKTELLSEQYVLKDGFDFQGARFNKSTIQEESSCANKISIKFLNKESYLSKIISNDFGKAKEIYQFFTNRPLTIDLDLKNYKIQINNIKDISTILNN